MNKKVKWGIIIFIGAGLIGGGIYSQLPKTNEELAAADKVMTGKRGGKGAERKCPNNQTATVERRNTNQRQPAA